MALTPKDAQTTTAAPTTTSAGRPWFTLLTAALLLAGFAYLSWLMLGHAQALSQADQFKWDRMVVVYSAIQSLGFAAAGVLLGTSVQQTRVAVAEGAAKANQDDAEKARSARRLIGGLRPPGAGPSQATVDAVAAVLN